MIMQMFACYFHRINLRETSALLQSTQNIVRRKQHVPVQGVPSTAIIVSNYVIYDAKTSPGY